MAGAGERRLASATPALLAAAALAVAAMATFIGWRSAREEVALNLRASFDFRVRDAESRIVQRLLAYEQVLHGAAGLFAASPRVDRAGFRDYVAALQLPDRYPGIQGVAFALLVPAAGKEAHLAAVRREGFPGYAIRPEGSRDPYSSVLYAEPFTERNRRSLGYDMLSEATRRAAMEQARDTGRAVLSGRVTLVTETAGDVQAGALLYVPVYRAGGPSGSPEERRASLMGWVYSPYRMADLMHGILGERSEDLDVEIFDGDEPSAATLMYDSAADPADPGGEQARLQAARPLDIAGHRWILVVRAQPSFEARLASDKPRLVALTGLGAGLLAALVVWLLASGRARAQRAAREMNADLLEAQRTQERGAAELRRSQEQLALAIEGSRDGTWDWNLQTGEVARSARFAEMLGLEPAEAEAMKAGREAWERRLHPDDAPATREALDAHLDGRAPQYDATYRLRTGQGGWRWVRSRGKAVERDGAGRPLRVTGLVTDVDLEKRAQVRLLEQARLQALEQNVNDAELVVRHDGGLVTVNDRAEAMYGYTREELCAMNIRELRPPGSRGAIAAQMAAILERGGGVFETEHRRRDGTAFPVEVSSRRLNVGGEVYVHSLVRDVTERRRLQDELRRALREQAIILENATVGITLVRERRQIWANRRMAELVGFSIEEMAGMPTRTLYPDEEAHRQVGAAAYPAMAAGRVYTVEQQMRRKDGSLFWARMYGRGIDPADPSAGSIWIFEDVSDRRAMEQRLLAATRLASVGTLAAGVAHEINNPLAWLHGNLTGALALLSAPDGAATRDEQLRQLLLEGLEGTERIAGVVKAMRALGRPEPVEEAQLVDVRAELLRSVQLVRSQLQGRAELTVELPDGLPPVRAQTSELGRVFLNLLLNALEAFPEGRAAGNRIRVAARAEGDEVVVEVGDNGVGIPEEVKARIFEAFFTTKPVGKGTGLGLSIARSIVDAAGGWIEVESAVGRGTTLRIRLPGAQDAAAPGPPGAEAAQDRPPAAPPQARRLRVLLVDDEPLVRTSLQRLLAKTHDVTTLASAEEALRRLDEGERWDALLCDLTMPGLDGVDLHAALAERHPTLLPRLAIVTGGAFGERSARFLASHEVVLLAKPVELEELLRVIDRLAAA